MSEEKIAEVKEEWVIEESPDRHEDPLLDCLIQLTKIHGRPATKTGLSAGLPLVDNRLTVDLFPRAAGRAGMSSRVIKKDLADLSPVQLPAIMLLHDRQACIVVSLLDNGARFKVLMPETGMGEKVITNKDLADLYTGYAIFVRPKYKIERKAIDAHGAGTRRHWFWGTIIESWRIYRDVLLAAFLINSFALISTFYILNVYDRVIPNSAYETLWVLSIGVVTIYIFSVIMQALRGHFIDAAGKQINLKLSAMLMEKVLGLKMEARPQSIGSFTNNLQEFESVRDFITSFSITALIDIPFMLLGLLVVWYIGGILVVVFIFAIIILGAYAYFIQKPLQDAVEKSIKASAQKNAILVEGVAGLETVKILGAESHVQRAWEEAVSYIARWSSRSRMLSASVQEVAYFVQNGVIVAVIIGGVYLITSGDMTQGALVAMVILSRQVLGPMAQVVNLATRYHRAKEALKTLDDIMKMPVERPPGKSFVLRYRFEGAIGVKNLNFAYPGQQNQVLNNITLQVNAGEKVGVIGAVGSGKTTLGKLMMGVYEPTNGMVTMDGTDIRQIDPAELRHFIGYVPQDITLFKGTVRDNVTMGTSDIDDHTVLRASAIAGVNNFVSKHPKGFDMEVGEFGRGLSGGQRQSIVLARALLLDPPVLILDEPTSNMDNRSEVMIRNNLAKLVKSKTLVLITHRASLLDMVDRLIVIDNGTIVADGPKAFVMEAMRKGQLNN